MKPCLALLAFLFSINSYANILESHLVCTSDTSEALHIQVGWIHYVVDTVSHGRSIAYYVDHKDGLNLYRLPDLTYEKPMFVAIDLSSGDERVALYEKNTAGDLVAVATDYSCRYTDFDPIFPEYFPYLPAK